MEGLPRHRGGWSQGNKELWSGAGERFLARPDLLRHAGLHLATLPTLSGPRFGILRDWSARCTRLQPSVTGPPRGPGLPWALTSPGPRGVRRAAVPRGSLAPVCPLGAAGGGGVSYYPSSTPPLHPGHRSSRLPDAPRGTRGLPGRCCSRVPTWPLVASRVSWAARTPPPRPRATRN